MLGAIVWGWVNTIRLTLDSEDLFSSLKDLVDNNVDYFRLTLTDIMVLLEIASSLQPELACKSGERNTGSRAQHNTRLVSCRQVDVFNSNADGK